MLNALKMSGNAQKKHSMLFLVEHQVMYSFFLHWKYVIFKKITEGVSQQPQSKKTMINIKIRNYVCDLRCKITYFF